MNSDIWKGFRHLLSRKRNRASIRWRWIALSIGILVSVGVYTYIINSVDPSNNFFSQISRYFQSPTYTFFSGGTKGVYHQIANAVHVEASKGHTRFSVINKNSSGGAENAIKVLTTPRSLGLVQEETIKEGDFISKEIEFIAPLYLERTHIILRLPQGYQGSFSKGSPPRLSSNSEKEVLELFATSSISIGPVGSGTRVIASYIMSEINAQIDEKRTSLSIPNGKEQVIFNLSMGEALERIEDTYSGNDKIDILFNIVGAPLNDIKELLEKDNYTLISIDPSLVTQINRKFNLNLRLTDFKNSKGGGTGIYYPESKNISTLGSYAWLISSKDIPNSDMLKVLEIIRDGKDGIAQNLQTVLNSSLHFQLDEIDFYDFYKSKYDRTNLGFWRSLLIFLGSFSISTVLVFSFVNFVVSLRKQSHYFNDVIAVLQRNFPKNTDLDEDEYDYKTPKISKNQTDVINRIISGIQTLKKLNIEINEDFESGGITNNSFNFLTQNIESTKKQLQEHFAKRIHEVIESGKNNSDFLTKSYIRKFYSAGYLLEADYFKLKQELEEMDYDIQSPD